MRLILFICLITAMNCKSQNENMGKLIYVGDPMCSWCYGIAPELSKTVKALDGHVEMELVMGGLRPYNKETMLDLKDFLTHHWEDVSKRSGQVFKYGILDTEILYDTEPACRAVVVARDMNEAVALDFFKAIQSDFYADNANPTDGNTFKSIAEKLGLDGDAFLQKWNSDAYRNKVKDDFARANTLGANSFPTIMLEHKGKVQVIAKGYATAQAMTDRVMAILKSEK